MTRSALSLLLLAAGSLPASAAAQQPGLRLFSAPGGPNQLQLVDGQGQLVHSWPNGSINTQGVHLGPDGSAVIAAFDSNGAFPGVTGVLMKMDFDGNLTWHLSVNSAQRLMHHDFFVLPNGNVLIMTVDNLQQSHALAAGRDPALLPAPNWFPETIIEVEQTGQWSGQIVWEWRLMDHIVQDFDANLPNYGAVSDHPELVNINYPDRVLQIGDWTHCNGIDYDPVNDWIIISARAQNEVWLIDHSTTTAEAAGHTGGARGRGGDILWRWGNPECYGRGTPADRKLFFQHDPRFIPDGYPGAGNITIFNNQVVATPTGGESAVIEIELPLDGSGTPFLDPATGWFGPSAPVWSYMAPGFYSPFVSGAQRLKTGNTLICQGMSRRLFEVTPAGSVVWEYVDPSPAGFIFQCDHVERSMWARTDEVSRSLGGTISTTTLNDTSDAGNLYLLLATLSGPGSTPLAGGVTLPITADLLTMGMILYPNTPLFIDTFGAINAAGRADAQVFVPGNFLDPALVGAEIDLVYLKFDSANAPAATSNVTKVKITG